MSRVTITLIDTDDGGMKLDCDWDDDNPSSMAIQVAAKMVGILPLANAQTISHELNQEILQ